MKNSEIVDVTTSYLHIKNTGNSTMSLPIAISWKRKINFEKLLKIRESILDELSEIEKTYFDDVHSETLVDKNGTLVREGNDEPMRVVKKEYREEFTKKKKELLELDTEVDIKKVKLSDLGDVKVTDEEMETLMFMLEDGEDG